MNLKIILGLGVVALLWTAYHKAQAAAPVATSPASTPNSPTTGTGGSAPLLPTYNPNAIDVSLDPLAASSLSYFTQAATNTGTGYTDYAPYARGFGV